MIKTYPFLDEGIQMIGLLKEEVDDLGVKSQGKKEELFVQMIVC